MKKIISMLWIVLLFCPVHASNSSSSILIQQGTHLIIEGNNIYETQSVASISKIMTAVIVLENCNVFNEITVSEDVLKTYGSSVYLNVGDKITILDLLYGLLLRSGNDCAVLLQSQVPHFVDKMNQKAEELEMNHSHFSNPSGLDEEDGGNISCVYDMALLMSYALENELFCKIVGTKEHERLDGKGFWRNKNKLLFSYEHCIGGKTGYTKKAGRTLVSVAQEKNLCFICVTFRMSDDFETHQKLYEYYFKKYEYFFDLDTF